MNDVLTSRPQRLGKRSDRKVSEVERFIPRIRHFPTEINDEGQRHCMFTRVASSDEIRRRPKFIGKPLIDEHGLRIGAEVDVDA